MNRPRYLRTLRSLAESYHAFRRAARAHAGSIGYTPAQFDVIATLGNTPGMSFKELGGATLITKGTLTGVVDRLAERGIVRRVHSDRDQRSSTVMLTAKGEREFARTFDVHVNHIAKGFAVLDERQMDDLDALLGRLRAGLEALEE